jgi:hypothetical protein
MGPHRACRGPHARACGAGARTPAACTHPELPAAPCPRTPLLPAPQVTCSPDADPSTYDGYQIALWRRIATNMGWAEGDDWVLSCVDWTPMIEDLLSPNGACTMAAAGAVLRGGAAARAGLGAAVTAARRGRGCARARTRVGARAAGCSGLQHARGMRPRAPARCLPHTAGVEVSLDNLAAGLKMSWPIYKVRGPP